LLRFLSDNFPGQGWDNGDFFYNSGAPIIWSRVAVAGFSQGAVVGAILARDVSLERYVAISGPERTLETLGPAGVPSMYDDPAGGQAATPPSRRLVFLSCFDVSQGTDDPDPTGHFIASKNNVTFGAWRGFVDQPYPILDTPADAADDIAPCPDG